MLDEGVELIFGVLVFVPLAANADADLAGNIADAVNPDGAVKAGVNFNFLGVHLLLGKPLEVADATRGALLESNALEQFVHIDCVVTAGGLHLGLYHLLTN